MSDLEDWPVYLKAFTYADDTSTIVSGPNVEEVIRKLEIDAKNVLKFMLANGLVVNASKTAFIILKKQMPQLKKCPAGWQWL